MKKLLLLSFFLLMSFGVGAANARPSPDFIPPEPCPYDGIRDASGNCIYSGGTSDSGSETTPAVEQKVISYSPEGVSNVVKNKDNSFSWTFSHKKHRSADTQANATPAASSTGGSSTGGSSTGGSSTGGSSTPIVPHTGGEN